MGSVGNQNPWAPYNNYKDCSLGICSIYCPQFCYLVFPPPPPTDDDTNPFSPLIIAVIGVLATAFLLVSYYTIVTRYCRRRNVHNQEFEDNHEGLAHDQWQVASSTGLDESLIKTLTVCKYKKSDGLIEGSECAVCLSEFQDNESLRLLPKCDHAFHLPCIDTWLKSHSNCPLCRANVIVLAQPVQSCQNSSAVNANAYEIHRPDDLVLVVNDPETNRDRHVVLSVGGDSNDLNSTSPNIQVNENPEDSRRTRKENLETDDQDDVKEFRRSISLGTFSCQQRILISDILKIDEDPQLGSDESLKDMIGSSKGLLRSPVAMKRSISTGRFIFTVHEKGKKSVLPN